MRCEGLKTAVELNGRVGYVMQHRAEGGQAVVRVNHGPGVEPGRYLLATSLRVGYFGGIQFKVLKYVSMT